MGRAQDLLEKAMQNIKESANNADFSDRCNDGLSRLDAQKDKFFFQSLAGLPSANKLFKASEKMIAGPNDNNMGEIETIIQEIEDKADAPGTVLT
jgi:tRNA A22 N-methylase